MCGRLFIEQRKRNYDPIFDVNFRAVFCRASTKRTTKETTVETTVVVLVVHRLVMICFLIWFLCFFYKGRLSPSILQMSLTPPRVLPFSLFFVLVPAFVLNLICFFVEEIYGSGVDRFVNVLRLSSQRSPEVMRILLFVKHPCPNLRAPCPASHQLHPQHQRQRQHICGYSIQTQSQTKLSAASSTST